MNGKFFGEVSFMLDDALLMQPLEGLGDPPLVSKSGEIWERLQDEKMEVSQSLLDGGLLLYRQTFGLESDVSEPVTVEFELRHLERLETRLRQLTEAQDRLLEGHYGRCTDCGNEITERRLEADPAAALCYSCQTAIDRTQRYRTL
jgi:RNA polymerase-binding transcription factor DksA